VQCDRERLGQRGLAQREPVGDGNDAVLVQDRVLRERAVVVRVLARRAAPGAQRRAPGHAVLARAAAQPGAADDLVTDLPAGHGVTDRGDPARVLVALDRAGLTPSLDHEVQVAAADAAVADREQHVVRVERRDRPLLDRHVELPVVDRRAHRLRNRRHALSLAGT
jgi:hypothetical protein